MSTPTPRTDAERCEICNSELSECGEATPDGTPSTDCLLCRARGRIAKLERELSKPRCDACGSDIIDKCFRCGAPQCCPSCCKIDSLERELEESQRQLVIQLECYNHQKAKHERELEEAREEIGSLKAQAIELQMKACQLTAHKAALVKAREAIEDAKTAINAIGPSSCGYGVRLRLERTLTAINAALEEKE